MKVASTIGYEAAHNELLAERDEDRFVARAIASLGPQPPNFKAIVAINRGPLRGDPEPPRPLVPRQLAAAADDGALVVDVRTDSQFDEAHVPGAVSMTVLRAGFGSKLAWLADPGQDIVLVGRDDEDARHAARLAAAVGIARVTGFLAGGMTSWREERRPVDRIARIDVEELHDRWDEIQLLDVRERSEWDEVHIPGSVFAPYHDVRGIPDGIDPARPVAAMCASGQRAAVAASLLQRYGAREVLHVVGGGVGTWARAGWPVE
jgi:rhodanese-related sulfurtransferase